MCPGSPSAPSGQTCPRWAPNHSSPVARLADSISFSVGASPERLRHSIEQVRRACAEAGRDFDELELGSYTQMAVVDGPDDPAREAIRGLTITHARFSGFEPTTVTADVGRAEHGEYRHAVETMELPTLPRPTPRATTHHPGSFQVVESATVRSTVS